MSGQEIAVRGENVPARYEEPQQVTSLVQLAIEKGVDVEVLERLVALQERVTERNARGAFFEALSDFQEKCPEIPKTKTAEIVTNSGARYSYQYAPLEAITRTIRPHLKAAGLSYTWEVETGQNALEVICVLRHVEGHSERSKFPVPVESAARMSPAQKNGAALTYGKRQSLLSVLGLTTAEQDIDGVEAAGEVERVSAEDAADLDDLIESVGADRAAFLEYMGVKALTDLPAKNLKRARDALQRKAKKGAR